MKFGEFQLHVIRESYYRLDGGAFFGVVPKTMWSQVYSSDALNRCLLACNVLLIDTGSARVLVDTGMGPRWTGKEKERFELETLIDHEHFLAQASLPNDAVDAVILSHLHFDHAGGGVILKDGKLVPAFAKAKYFVQKGELELSRSKNLRARGSYRVDDIEPLVQQGAIEAIEGDKEVVPGVFVRVTGGHTSHHQVISFESKGEKGVFLADIMPTKSHFNPAWVMAYDHRPLETCDLKHQWLARAADESWLVMLDHETQVPWGKVARIDGKYAFQPLAAETLS